MTLRVCNTCHKHLFNSNECTECSEISSHPRAALRGRAMLVGALLGLGLTACGEKDEDTSSEPSSETEPDAAALYGVAESPQDED